jgi:hypothetical protein
MMQVQLKQSEIEAALKGYIAQQGINLNNKTVTCTFTAGRKDSGISVELEIEDQAVPVPPVPVGGQLTFVPTSPSIALQAEPTEPVAEATPAPPTTSLFS